MSIEIVYTDDDRPYPGSVILPDGADWRNDAAYYLTLPGYRILRVVSWLLCIRCKGLGSWRIKPKHWRKRTAPPWWACKLVECRHCAGYGYVGGALLDHSTLTASDYVQR